MPYSSLAIEIITLIISLIALVFNTIAITLIFNLKKELGWSQGLRLMLLVSIYDLIGPTIGLVQGISSRILDYNILKNTSVCQLIGIVETLVPFLSSSAVAFLSLERYLFIFQIILSKKVIIMVPIVNFILGLILASLATITKEYKLSSSRMICMVTPYGSVYGNFWFYGLLIFLLFNTIVIVFCYSKIIALRRLMSKSVTINVGSIATTESNNHRTENFITKCFDNINETSPEESTTYSWLIKYKPDRFVIKSLILMLSYLICILPTLTVMIYQAVKFHVFNYDLPLSTTLSNIMFLPMFSISLVNPLLLMSLHTKVADLLDTYFKMAFD